MPREPAAPEVPPTTPFAFSAFRQEYAVPGTVFNPADRTIRFEDDRALNRMKQMLSHGREWEARGRQELVGLKRENEALRHQPVEEIEKARAFMQEWTHLMQMPPEELAAFLEAARTQWPLIEARAERAYAERLREQATMAQTPPEPDVEVIVEEVQHGAADLVEDYLANQPWATPDVRQTLVEYLQDRATMNQYVGRARTDMPDIGLRAGQYAADWDTARALVERMAKPYRDAHAQLTAQQTAATQKLQQTTKIAAQNAATLAQAKPKAPAPKPTPAPAAPRRSIREEIAVNADRIWREVQAS